MFIAFSNYITLNSFISYTFYITILLNTHTASCTTNRDPLWCYCTMCANGLQYCKTNGGSCFNITINGSYNFYGCYDENEAILECGGGGNNSNVEVKKYCTTHSYCNVDEQTLNASRDRLIDPERENSLEKLSCYCNTCGVYKSCTTTGLCYRDRSEDLTYGCRSNVLPNGHCEIIYSSHMEDRLDNIDLSCCRGEKWCNFDPILAERPDAFLLYTHLEIAWVRFERWNYGPEFIMRAQNRIGGKVKVKVSDQLNQTQEYVTADGSFPFQPTRNYMYKFELVPMVGNYELKPSRTFYFTKMLYLNLTKFPADLEYDIFTEYVIICRLCKPSINQELECEICLSFKKLTTNPIWVTQLI